MHADGKISRDSFVLDVLAADGDKSALKNANNKQNSKIELID